MRVSLCVPGSSCRCSSTLWRIPTVLVASFITKLWLPTIPVTVDFILIFLSFRQQSLVNWTISCTICPRNFMHFLFLFIFVIDLCMDQGNYLLRDQAAIAVFFKKLWATSCDLLVSHKLSSWNPHFVISLRSLLVGYKLQLSWRQLLSDMYPE